MNLYNPGAGIADMLRNLMGKWSTNNAAAQGGIYQELGPSPSQGPAPTSDELTAMSGVPDPLRASLMPPVQPTRARRRAPAYDTAAMDYLTAPVTEGPNPNIDDETRARALAWALRQQQ
jgi:hypothetical protein